MKHERMKILELLEAGKITADEAANLLNVIKRPQDDWHVWDEETAENMEEKFSRFTKHVDNFTRDFGGKVETVYKDIEPKLKKASQTVLEKTAAIFDNISKSLNESLENARRADGTCECCGKDPCGCEEEKAEGCCCCDDAPKEN